VRDLIDVDSVWRGFVMCSCTKDIMFVFCCHSKCSYRVAGCLVARMASVT